MSDWTLALGDGIAGMAAMGNGSVDHIVTDPPYDSKTHAGAVNSDGEALGIDFACLENVAFARDMIRVSARWVVAFCALEQLGGYRDVAGDDWIRSGVWVRTNGAPQMSGDRPAQGAEGVAIMHRGGRKKWNGGGNRAAWTGPRESDSVHPTQKPPWLVEALIRDFTDPGDLVLDPFAGSGTTGVACIRLGRRFVGWELDPKYHAIAMKRLNAAREQLLIPTVRTKAKQELLLK